MDTKRMTVDFDAVVDGNGEVHFQRVERDASKYGQDFVSHHYQWPATEEKLNTDPTLSIFYSPIQGFDHGKEGK